MGNGKLVEWAIEHSDEWEVVCGNRETGMRNIERIMNMLLADKFFDLADVMACRLYQHIYDDAQIERTYSRREKMLKLRDKLMHVEEDRLAGRNGLLQKKHLNA